jgi:hypothetical protein
VLKADGAIPNLAANATCVSISASTCATIENAYLFFGSLMMKSELQPGIKIKLHL